MEIVVHSGNGSMVKSNDQTNYSIGFSFQGDES